MTHEKHVGGERSHWGLLFLHHLMRTGCASTSNSAIWFIKQHSYYTHCCEKVDFCHHCLIFNHHLLHQVLLATAAVALLRWSNTSEDSGNTNVHTYSVNPNTNELYCYMYLETLFYLVVFKCFLGSLIVVGISMISSISTFCCINCGMISIFLNTVYLITRCAAPTFEFTKMAMQIAIANTCTKY